MTVSVETTGERPGWRERLTPGGAFLGAVTDRERARAVLVGVPMDFTVTARPGARLAPQRIRAVSDVLEEYSLELDAALADHPFHDAGDATVTWGNAAATLANVREIVAGVAAEGRVPCLLGGEHLLTLAAVEALRSRHPELVVVQFDAHADLRDSYAGETLSHATVMRRVAELLPPGRVYQFGVRSATPEELAWARGRTRVFPGEVLGPLREVLPELRRFPLYVTVDVDVVDPAFAPGTSTPEPGGVTAREILAAVAALRGCQVVGFDLVEVCPPCDPADVAAVLGARIVRDALLCFA